MLLGGASVRLILSKWTTAVIILVLINVIVITFITESRQGGRPYIQGSNHSSGGTLTCIDYRKLNWTGSDNHTSLHASNQMLHPALVTVKKSLSPQDIGGVEKFVFFVGYPRSGHSIVASMMDAHPNMIIAHEYNLFRQWQKKPSRHSQKSYLYNTLYRNSITCGISGWRSGNKEWKGYNLGVDYKWQAGFTDLKVIGDKSGAVTLQVYEKNPQVFEEILANLKQTVGVPLRVIHVVRNPYDMISTRLLYADSGNKRKLPATQDKKHCNDYGLSYHTNRTFLKVSSIHNFTQQYDLAVLDVHHADFVRQPRKTLTMICRFLNLQCPSDYLDACEKKVYKRLSKTRLLVHWPEKMVEEVYKLTREYRFFWRYSFQGD